MVDRPQNKLAEILVSYDDLITRFYDGDECHAYDFFGAHPVAGDGAESWFFALWAPHAKYVSIVGDWNGWDPDICPMERHRGIWVALAGGSGGPGHGDLYKYVVTGEDGEARWKADPYAFRCEHPPGTASQLWDLGPGRRSSSVFGTVENAYKWGDSRWIKKRENQDIIKQPVSIYEMHLASWRISDGVVRADNDPDPDSPGILPGITSDEGKEYPSFRLMADALADYLADMGYTHVELLPVNEYPYDGSWGYQITGYFAITSRFGTPQDFMYFVDTLHSKNIGVIVDWAPSGFPKDAFSLTRFDGTRLYEHKNKSRRELPNWGTNAFTFGRPEVKSFLTSSAMLFMDAYHIDGLRVDAVSSMLYLDYGREEYVPNKDGGNIDYDAVKLLRSLNKDILTEHRGCFTVAEESTAFPLVTKPPEDGGLGFVFKWNMGYMNDSLDYMRTDPLFRKGNHERMTFSMYYAFSENYVLAYSHDEAVHGKASMLSKMSADFDSKFDSLRVLFAWQYAHPGKKLNFMGSELAQVIEWDNNKQLDWILLDYEKHRGMQEWVKELNHILKKQEALYGDDSGWSGFTWLNVDDRRNSVFAFLRSCGESHMVCVFNFTSVMRENYVVALPSPGDLSLVLNSDEKRFGGASERAKKNVKSKCIFLNGMENGAALDLPPLSAQYYLYKKKPAIKKVKEKSGE